MLELGCVITHLHREVHAYEEGDSKRKLGQEAADQYHDDKKRDVKKRIFCANARRTTFVRTRGD